MTHEEILQCSASQLEAMTDAELLKWYEPYLKITRPELAEKPTPGKRVVVNQNIVKKGRVNAILANLGLDLQV